MKQKTKRKIIMHLPYFLIAAICANFGEAWRLSEGNDISEKVDSMLTSGGLARAFSNILPGLHPLDIIVGIVFALLFYFAIKLKKQNAKKFRHGIEYGSARWGTKADIEPFEDEKASNNIILSATENMTMNSRPKELKYARNKNVLVVGGSGSGKTRFFILPQLLQMHSSYVLTDPKGTLLGSVGKMFNDAGYDVKIFNTVNFKKSMRYNPFVYIHSEKDILKLVTILMANTKGDGHSNDPFWERCEKMLYSALIGYIHYEAPEEERNFTTLLEMINSMEIREDDENFENAVDVLMNRLAAREPDHFAVRQYVKFKIAAGKTAKSVLICCGSRLACFDIRELRELTEYDELELDTLGDRKKILFLIMSDTDDTFNFLIGMIYSQLFNLLCEKADDYYGGHLPVHVRCLVDETANVGQIPNLEKLVATIRSREISACLVLQAKSQLKAIYKDHAETIIGNMDSQVFLGGSEQTTLKDLNTILGKETIDLYNTGESRGTSRSYNQNYSKTGRDLMSIDEIASMDGSKCIVQVRGIRPFLSDKYDVTKHPNYKLTADADKRNRFDVEKFLDHTVQLNDNDGFDFIGQVD